jgi:hypothetical protein
MTNILSNQRLFSYVNGSITKLSTTVTGTMAAGSSSSGGVGTVGTRGSGTSTGSSRSSRGGASTSPPDQKPILTAKEEWNKNNQKALTSIRLRVTDTVLIYLTTEKTAAVAWRKLESIYQAKTKLNVVIVQ